ncbi:MAG: FAD:protein FMN transferase [Bacteroidota bacterium]
MTKRLFFLLITLLFFSCGSETQQPTVLRGNAFGTTYAIQYFSDTPWDAEKGIDSVIYKVNKSVSTYLPKSDISRINQGDTTIVTDAIFKEVFRISEVVYTNSKGYFDPTIGVLRNAYGFGEEKPLEQMDSITLDSLREFVGFRKVKILSNGTVRKNHPEIYFDFNAVAKGYGIDLIGRYFESKGVENYLIELGGELLAKGENVGKDTSWLAGVESIDSDLENRTASAIIKLDNRAMASSGNYRKFRIDTLSGQKYVHTINPLTGKAQQSDVTSATVLAPNCALADAYATAFMAMGLQRSKELLPKLAKVEAYLTYVDATNSPREYITDGFQELISE